VAYELALDGEQMIISNVASDEELDSETMLLYCILCKSITQWNFEVLSPKQLLRAYTTEIQISGRVLRFLGLADVEEQRPIGWKATPLLMRILVGQIRVRRNPHKLKSTWGDDFTFRMIYDAVGKDTITLDKEGFAKNVLVVLGLAQHTHDGSWIATDL